MDNIDVNGNIYDSSYKLSSSDKLQSRVTEDIIYFFSLVNKTEIFEKMHCIERNGDKSVMIYTHYSAPEPSVVESVRYNPNVGTPENDIVFYIEGMDFIQNSIYRTNSGEYVKLLIAYYGDNENISSLIWEFTDGDYLNSDNEIIKDVLKKFDEGIRGDTVVLENGSVKVFEFKNFVTISQKQNKLGYSYELIDANITKTAINKTANLNDEVSFNITYSNLNNESMSDVYIVESYNKALIFIGYESSRSWTTTDNKTWYLVGDLGAGENASIIFRFRVNSTGILENNVTAYMADFKLGNSSDSVKVRNPDISVYKNSLNQTVQIGNAAMFEIIVENTGDVDLSDVYVVESEFDSELVYLSYENATGNWRYELKDSKHTFYLDSVLKAGESVSLIVSFNTTKTGNFTNTVIAGFENRTVNSTNSTEVVDNTTEVPENNTEIPKNTTDSVKNESKNSTVDNTVDIETSVDKTPADLEINESPKSGVLKQSRKSIPYETGNPIFVLFVIFMTLVATRRKI